MTSKIFQANHKSQWLSTKSTSAGGLKTGPLEAAIKVVALTTRLLKITVGMVSSVTRLPALVDKMVSPVTRPLALVVVRCLWP